jgi:hypothetical protein
MSEGSITYVPDGDICGITTVINSQLRNHRVCQDGLACVETDIGNNITGKICQSVEVLTGERCLPNYDMCYGGLLCRLNVYGDYTCGGDVPWSGNEVYVKSGYVKYSGFEMHVYLIIIGILIMILYCTLLFYELCIKKITNDEERKHGNDKKHQVCGWYYHE